MHVFSAGIYSTHVPDLSSLWLGVVARLAISAGLRLVLSCRDSFEASKGRSVLIGDDGGANASEKEVTSTKKITETQILMDMTGGEGQQEKMTS